MKKLLYLVAALLTLSVSQALAQPRSIPADYMRPGTAFPSVCIPGEVRSDSTSTVKVCAAGGASWTTLAAGGGSVSGLTAGRVVVAASATTLTNYAGFTHDGTTLTVAGLKDTALTSGRVPFATTGGLLTDSANYVFDGAGLFTITGSSRILGNTSSADLILSSATGSQLRYANQKVLINNSEVDLYTNSLLRMIVDNGGLVTVGATGLAGQFNVTAGSAATIGQIIKLAASQSADAFEVQDSSGIAITRILSDGQILGSTNIQAGTSAYLGWDGSSMLKSPSNGVITLLNNAQADFTRLQFGGTTSSFPSLKRSGTALQARLADDSAYAPIYGSYVISAIDGSAANPALAVGSGNNNGLYYLSGTTNVLIGAVQGTTAGAGFRSGSQGGGIALGDGYPIYWTINGNPSAAAQSSISQVSAGVIGVGTGAAGSVAGSMSMTGLTLAGNFFAGPSTIETEVTTGSAIGATLNYYTDSQTIYRSTAAAANDVTLNVDASASVDLNTRLATGQVVTVVLAMTNTGTAYKCNTLQVHTVGQTINWLNGSAPTGVVNGTDEYTFTIRKTGASTYFVTGSMASYR